MFKNRRVLDPLNKTPGKFEWFWLELNIYLSKQGLKQTRQREEIVEVFLTLNPHVDAEFLYETMRGKGSQIGLATIYRTLNLLKEAHLVEQNVFRDGRNVFEVCRPETHHDHLICKGCDLIIEFEKPEIERLQEVIAKEHGFTLTHHRLDLFGFCSSCRAK